MLLYLPTADATPWAFFTTLRGSLGRKSKPPEREILCLVPVRFEHAPNLPQPTSHFSWLLHATLSPPTDQTEYPSTVP